MHDLSYNERLKALKLHSLQRRRERYCIIYVWKVLEGLVPNFSHPITATLSDRRGRSCIISNVNVGRKGTLAFNSFRWRSIRMFNGLPKYLRNITLCSVEVLIYRPPDASLSNFFDITNRIETTLLENNASASDILLLGDFNLPHIKWDNGHASNNATAHGRLLLAITELFYLEQIVDKPTRVNNILDLVFCTHTVSNGYNILPMGISDHNIITITMNITLTLSNSLPHNICYNVLETLDYHKADWCKLNDNLNSYDWESEINP